MTEKSPPGKPPLDESIRMTQDRLAAISGNLAATAADLRRAVNDGTVPPNATERIADRLEDLATRMRQGLPHQPAPDTSAPGDDRV